MTILNEKLQQLELGEENISTSGSSQGMRPSGSSQSSSSNVALNETTETDETELLRKRFGTERSVVPQISTVETFRAMLMKFSHEPKIVVGSNEPFNLLEYWFLRRFQNPEIYRLTQVALAAAPTEVEVERMFSSLLLVLTHLRNRLSREVLDSIMLIKMNLDLLTEIDFNAF